MTEQIERLRMRLQKFRDSPFTLSPILIAALFSLIAAIGGYAFNAIDRRMATTEGRVSVIELGAGTRSERIMRLETENEHLTQQLSEINSKLDRIIQMHMK